LDFLYPDGRRLLGHELAHALQQGQADPPKGALRIDAGLGHHEADADAPEQGSSRAPGAAIRIAVGTLQRKPTSVRLLSATVDAEIEEAKRAAGDAAIAEFRSWGAGSDADNQTRALELARTTSYAMSGKSLAEASEREVEDVWHAITGSTGYKRARVQSVLGGAFLRMYLDGKVDPSVVTDAGEEIAASPEFARLAAALQGHLAHQRIDPAKAESQITSRADAYLRARLAHRGIAFRYELNAVIGGVSGVGATGATAAPAGSVLRYTVTVEFSDSYDFKNRRSGAYERYRKHLAALLFAGMYPDFWEAYWREATGVRRTTSLDKAAIFASYMYAVEEKGWTPGPLPWRVAIPMRGSVPLTGRPSGPNPARSTQPARK
jgi:hypothetical protein